MRCKPLERYQEYPSYGPTSQHTCGPQIHSSTLSSSNVQTNPPRVCLFVLVGSPRSLSTSSSFSLSSTAAVAIQSPSRTPPLPFSTKRGLKNPWRRRSLSSGRKEKQKSRWCTAPWGRRRAGNGRPTFCGCSPTSQAPSALCSCTCTARPQGST